MSLRLLREVGSPGPFIRAGKGGTWSKADSSQGAPGYRRS